MEGNGDRRAGPPHCARRGKFTTSIPYIEGHPYDIKKIRPEALFLPPKRRASFSARHTSKDVEPLNLEASQNPPSSRVDESVRRGVCSASHGLALEASLEPTLSRPRAARGRGTMWARLDMVGEVRHNCCQFLVEAGCVRYLPYSLTLVEELLDYGEVLLSVAHPGCVSGTMERVHQSLRVCLPELGAHLRCYGILIRLQN